MKIFCQCCWPRALADAVALPAFTAARRGAAAMPQQVLLGAMQHSYTQQSIALC